MDYLVTMTTHVPDGVTQAAITAVREREAAHTAELARAGNVLRLWRPPLRPGEWRTLGLFATDNDQQLEQILAEMPLRIWRRDTVTPLGPHPNDPGPGRVALDPQRTEFLTTLVLDNPARHRHCQPRRHHHARGSIRTAARRGRSPDPAVDAARAGPQPRSLASHRLRTDDGASFDRFRCSTA